MSRAWSCPDLQDGPLKDLFIEMHRLHDITANPSSRWLAKRCAAAGFPLSHSAVHMAWKTAALPNKNVLLWAANAMFDHLPPAARTPHDASRQLKCLDQLWCLAELRNLQVPASTPRTAVAGLAAVKMSLNWAELDVVWRVPAGAGDGLVSEVITDEAITDPLPWIEFDGDLQVLAEEMTEYGAVYGAGVVHGCSEPATLAGPSLSELVARVFDEHQRGAGGAADALDQLAFAGVARRPAPTAEA